MISMQRSNVRLHSNVHIRTPGCEAQADESFKKAVRTREAILELHPWIRTSLGIDWPVARASLDAAQLEVLRDHFPCPHCQRWDRYPVSVAHQEDEAANGWRLSRTPFGCLCCPERAQDHVPPG